MTRNEGTIDRLIRISVGFALLSLVFFGPKTWWGLLGLVPLMTGYLGFCPIYELCGVSSCPPQSRPAKGSGVA